MRINSSKSAPHETNLKQLRIERRSESQRLATLRARLESLSSKTQVVFAATAGRVNAA